MAKSQDDMLACAELCGTCAAMCVETWTYSLDFEDGRIEPAHLRRLLACAEICRANEAMLRIGSEFHELSCYACGEICDRAAREFDRFDDPQIRDCAEECRRCADACRHMSGAVA